MTSASSSWRRLTKMQGLNANSRRIHIFYARMLENQDDADFQVSAECAIPTCQCLPIDQIRNDGLVLFWRPRP